MEPMADPSLDAPARPARADLEPPVRGERSTPTTAPDAAGALAGFLLEGLRVRPDSEIAEMERQERSAAARGIVENLPPALRDPSPAELLGRVQHEKLERVAKTWEPRAGGLVLLGPTGAGKSSAAAYLFRRLLGRGVRLGGVAWRWAERLRWFPATELERARREHPLGKGEAPEIVLANQAALLFIDDAAWERNPEAVSDVIAARYDSGSPTVITSHQDRAGLVAHYGTAVVRKIFETAGKGNAQCVEVL